MTTTNKTAYGKPYSKLNVYLAIGLDGRPGLLVNDVLFTMKDFIIRNHPDKLINWLNDGVYEYLSAKHIESNIDGYLNEDGKRAEFEIIARCVDQIGRADVVYFEPNSLNSRGCEVERVICELYGKPYATVPRHEFWRDYPIGDKVRSEAVASLIKEGDSDDD